MIEAEDGFSLAEQSDGIRSGQERCQPCGWAAKEPGGLKGQGGPGAAAEFRARQRKSPSQGTVKGFEGLEDLGALAFARD
jgi:hypothetical protein